MILMIFLPLQNASIVDAVTMKIMYFIEYMPLRRIKQLGRKQLEQKKQSQSQSQFQKQAYRLSSFFFLILISILLLISYNI